MPAGLDVTLPLPLPALLTVSGNCCWATANVAVTVVLVVKVMAQGPVPVQAPLHPPKTEPAAGAALRVTGVPAANGSVQSAPQSMPVGLDVTVPLPAPALATERRGEPWGVVFKTREIEPTAKLATETSFAPSLSKSAVATATTPWPAVKFCAGANVPSPRPER